MSLIYRRMLIYSGQMYPLQIHPRATQADYTSQHRQNADILSLDRRYDLFNIHQFLLSHIENHTKEFCHRSDNAPKSQQVNDTRQVTQITYVVLYKHSALHSHHLHFCIIPLNVCKCYTDCFHSTPIYSYSSTPQ